MSDINLDLLTVFHGDLSPQRAYLYVRRDGGGQEDDLHLRGVVRGPRSRLTRTLPASIPLNDLGTGPHGLARSVIPDPCFWGPAQPYLYDIDIVLRRGEVELAAAHRVLGLRMFGVAGRRLYLEAKPWVLCGADESSVSATDAPSWRQAGLVRYVVAPPADMCEEMSEEGVLLAAEIRAARGPSLAAEVRRLAACASVGLIVVRDGDAACSELRYVAPNTLLAEYFLSGQPVDPQSWADVAICESRCNHDLPEGVSGCRIPVIIRRSTDTCVSLAEAGRRCRQLSDDLAELGEFAGVFV